MVEYQYLGYREQRHTIDGVDITLHNHNTFVVKAGSQRAAQLEKEGVIKCLGPVVETSKKKK